MGWKLGDVFGGLPIVFIVLITTCSSVKATALQNVALAKSTEQIGTAWGGVSSRAVDGNTGSHFHNHATCSHTSLSPEAWWKVDLDDVYVIDHVTIYDRTDGGVDYLKNVQLSIGLDDNDYNVLGYEDGVVGDNIFTFQLLPYVYSRWVKITQFPTTTEGNALILCEAQVMGSEVENAKVLKLKHVEDVIGTGVVLDTSQANSMISCCIQCKKTSKCVAVNYNNETGTCEKLETVSTVSDSNENTFFYRLN